MSIEMLITLIISPQLLTDYCQLCFEVLDKIPEDVLLTNEFHFPEYKQDVN